MIKNKLTSTLVFGGMALTGLVVGVATIAGAQSIGMTTTTAPVTTTAITSTTAIDTPEAGDVADTQTETKAYDHAPLGGDGIVTSINGTTIVFGEESDESAVSYTVDARKATITNNGVAATLADIKVGAKIFVKGTVTGTNVTATDISLGHGGIHHESGNDAEGGNNTEGTDGTDGGTDN
jgi:hypothetical protein